MKKETYITMDYHELEELIKKHFDVPKYEVLCDLEASNDSYQVIYASASEWDKEWNDEYYMEKFREWLESKGRKSPRITNMAMCKLAKNGIIEDGAYLINICW